MAVATAELKTLKPGSGRSKRPWFLSEEGVLSVRSLNFWSLLGSSLEEDVKNKQ